MTTELKPKDLIKVTQLSEIEYTKLKEFHKKITSDLATLNLDTIVVNEENLKEIKKIRTEVRKNLKSFEDTRKMMHKKYNEPYKVFEREYNKLVKKPLEDADKLLKEKADIVEDEIRNKKTKVYKEMFENLKRVYKIDFVEFEDAGLNVQISTPEIELHNQVEDFFSKIKNDLLVIEKEEYKERILVDYMKHRDLSKAIVDVKNSIEQEERLVAAQELAKKRHQDEKEASSKELEQEASTNTQEETKTPEIEAKEPEAELEITFKVKGTREQLISVREFMKDNGIQYE